MEVIFAGNNLCYYFVTGGTRDISDPNVQRVVLDIGTQCLWVMRVLHAEGMERQGFTFGWSAWATFFFFFCASFCCFFFFRRGSDSLSLTLPGKLTGVRIMFFLFVSLCGKDNLKACNLVCRVFWSFKLHDSVLV